MPETKALRSWREILASACENPQQKQEVANQIGFVTVRTLDRWISGQNKPQKNEFIRKLALMNEEMLEALQQEFPEAFVPKQAVVTLERVNLPSEFYRRVVQACAHVPFSSRRWTIWHLVSNQMLPHLDPERVGLMAMYVRVRNEALFFEEGAGNTTWTSRQWLEQATPHAAEQWLVQDIVASRPFFIQSCIASQLLPPSCLLRADLIQSIGYFPLYRAALTGGGLLLCAGKEDFFTPLRQTLVEEYSCLFELMLNDSDFQTEP